MDSRILAFSDVLRRAIYTGAAAIVLITMVVTGCTLFLGVVVRYGLHTSLAWSAELPTILFPWMIMGGITIAAAGRRHLGVDYVLRRLPRVLRKATGFLLELLLVTLMLVLAAQAPKLLQYLQYQSTPVLDWPASWAFYSVPLGFICVAILALLRLPQLVVEDAADNETAG